MSITYCTEKFRTLRGRVNRVVLGFMGSGLVCLTCVSVDGQDPAQVPKPGPKLRSEAAPKAASISIGLAPSDNQAPADQASQAEAKSSEVQEREQRFAEQMTGATLVGRFTILGQDAEKMPSEEYTIAKCEKLPEADMFRFTARIKYGEVDSELPLDLPVLWAGDTPVITLTNLWIPGMGTFSSRVMIYKDSYAGTWQHDAVGGHMFGIVRRAEVAAAGADAEVKPAANQLPAKPVTISN